MEIPSNEELERAERIDPDSLLTEEDRMKPLNIRKSKSTAFTLHQPTKLTQPSHSRSMQAQHQTSPRMQRLQLRPSRATQRRRCREALQCRCEPGQAAGRGPRGGRLHCAGQGRFLRKLRPRRCVQVRWLSVHRPAGVQAGRGGEVGEQRCTAVRGRLFVVVVVNVLGSGEVRKGLEGMR